LIYLPFGSIGELPGSQDTSLPSPFGPLLRETPGFEHETCVERRETLRRKEAHHVLSLVRIIDRYCCTGLTQQIRIARPTLLSTTILSDSLTHCALCERLGLWPHLRNGDVINHGRRIPVGIQVVVSSLEWSRSREELVQVSSEVLRIGS
jgi:hypothetical protein